MSLSEASSISVSHRVLARKYRPTTFEDMVGQQTLVRVLSNGIRLNRLPSAFVLTGIRGVGKTTTARIIARALNCIGKEGEGGPTPHPCGVCEPCRAIAEDRHMDVIEMDAASRTGVEDVRDVIEGTRYKPVSARFKIYIIDEVHMLSKNAFNAFLKTLEEPPPHVKFIFATTELKKIPETVLSRCMRLQLRRIELSVLKNYFAHICAQENRLIEDAALILIARAAEGSVRDGLSILDQAMTLCTGLIEEKIVLEMLGLSDRSNLFILFKALIQGKPAEALGSFQQMYDQGADPLMILQDLLDFTHWLTLQKMSLNQELFPGLRTDSQEEFTEMGKALSFPLLSRFWQALVKGRQEAALAPSAKQGTEMILCRLCYMANLPTPEHIIQNLTLDRSKTLEVDPKSFPPSSEILHEISKTDSPAQIPLNPVPVLQKTIEPLVLSAGNSYAPMPETFEDLLSLLNTKKEMILKGYLENDAHLISFAPGHLCMRFLATVPKDTARRLRDLLVQWTSQPWQVTTSVEKGSLTVREQGEKARAQIREKLLNDPLVKNTLEVFPEAQIHHIEDHPDQKTSR